MDKAELLKELRIERDATWNDSVISRRAASPPRRRSRGK